MKTTHPELQMLVILHKKSMKIFLPGCLRDKLTTIHYLGDCINIHVTKQFPQYAYWWKLTESQQNISHVQFGVNCTSLLVVIFQLIPAAMYIPMSLTPLSLASAQHGTSFHGKCPIKSQPSRHECQIMWVWMQRLNNHSTRNID